MSHILARGFTPTQPRTTPTCRDPPTQRCRLLLEARKLLDEAADDVTGVGAAGGPLWGLGPAGGGRGKMGLVGPTELAHCERVGGGSGAVPPTHCGRGTYLGPVASTGTSSALQRLAVAGTGCRRHWGEKLAVSGTRI